MMKMNARIDFQNLQMCMYAREMQFVTHGCMHRSSMHLSSACAQRRNVLFAVLKCMDQPWMRAHIHSRKCFARLERTRAHI